MNTVDFKVHSTLSGESFFIDIMGYMCVALWYNIEEKLYELEDENNGLGYIPDFTRCSAEELFQHELVFDYSISVHLIKAIQEYCNSKTPYFEISKSITLEY